MQIAQGWLHTGLPRGFSMSESSKSREPVMEFRLKCRRGEFQAPTCGLLGDYVQANLVGVPRRYAFDYLRFVLMNSRGCPLLDIVDGQEEPSIAKGTNLSTDLPQYVVLNGSESSLRSDISSLVRNNDLVFFLIGCSFTWESLLEKEGLPQRHVEEGKNVPMYRTGIRNRRSGVFGGFLVVSMRPYKEFRAEALNRITGDFPGAHGAPIAWGNPHRLGIADLNKPDYGDPVTIRDGEVPFFWACGVTLLESVRSAELEVAVTHAPGHMLITDILVDELREQTQDAGS